MAEYTVIADVGASLVRLLRQAMTPSPIAQPERIGLAAPNDKGDLQLALYLYEITRADAFRQTQMISRGESVQQYPPMTLNLRYLLTAYSDAGIQFRAEEETRILGRAVQTLYDNSIVRGDLLAGSLAQSDEEIRIVMEHLPISGLAEVWNFKDVPYRLSISYSVGPVYLDSTRLKTTKRVVERHVILAE